jgi:hypothetical protein
VEIQMVCGTFYALLSELSEQALHAMSMNAKHNHTKYNDNHNHTTSRGLLLLQSAATQSSSSLLPPSVQEA